MKCLGVPKIHLRSLANTTTDMEPVIGEFFGHNQLRS